jgi:hypothetical protein
VIASAPDRTTDYYRYLESKVVVSPSRGVRLNTSSLHPSTKPHQRHVIEWALRNGRGLIGADFGLGKTHILCEIASSIVQATGKRFLVVCPLGVRTQFIVKDGPRLGVRWEYVRTDAEVQAATSPFLITNYERVRDGAIDPRRHDLAGVGLDEGNIIGNLGTKTEEVFLELFAEVPYRYVATATPAPNEYRQLIYYAEFLGEMDHGQALTRWFKRDPEKAGNLQLHPQHEEEFWLWVASWALFVHLPSDLGYSDEGYTLPELQIHWHRLDVDHTRAWDQADSRGQGMLLLDPTLSATAAAKEKRATLASRVERMLAIMAAESPDTHWLLWHDLEAERGAIEAAVPGVATIYGSQDLEINEANLLGFTDGEIPILATKPQMSGLGTNLQYHCNHAIFLGVNYKFRDFIQAVHRIYRFQQDKPVHIHILYAASEDKVRLALLDKWARHDKLQETMRGIQRQYGLSRAAIAESLRRKLGVERNEARGDFFTLVRNDCVVELLSGRLADSSVGLIATSIPFGNHYEYTAQYEDFGHNPDDAAFWQQMDYLIPELLRVLKPGRVAAIHVKDRILYGHQTRTGFMEVSPFHAEAIFAFRSHGWLFEGMRTITTDVVRENNGTYRLSYSEMLRDASKMGSGLPEYLLLFRKPPTSTATARADEPVCKNGQEYSLGRWQIDAHAYWRSTGKQLGYDYEAHVGRLDQLRDTGNLPTSFFVEPPASNSDWVWDDVQFMHCLNARQQRRRVENHVCPLPLDTVERVIRLYSNRGDLVLDPFSGIGTVPYLAVKLGRLGYGIELSERYWEDGVSYCQEAETERKAPRLFDWEELEIAPQPGSLVGADEAAG